MTDTATFSQACCIDAAHPALPGHFPGRPLVPGVVLLEQVASALRAWRGQRMSGVLEAKFIAPLLPAQHALVCLTPVGEDTPLARFEIIRFEIRRDSTVLARGIVEGAT